MPFQSKFRLISYSQELVDGQPLYASSNYLHVKTLNREPARHSFHVVTLKLCGCVEEKKEVEDEKVVNNKEQTSIPSFDSYSSKVSLYMALPIPMGNLCAILAPKPAERNPIKRLPNPPA
ncbi:hypothetical protein FF1_022454 [Malus domestica]